MSEKSPDARADHTDLADVTDATDLTALIAGTLPRRESPLPARFTLELRRRQEQGPVVARLEAELARFDPRVSPLSRTHPDVLVLELGRTTLDGADPAAAFRTGYALADRYHLRSAEPDLPAAFFPETEPAPSPGAGPRSGAPAVARVSLAIPGCDVSVDEHLLPKPWALDRMKIRDAWAWSVAQGRPAQGAGIVVAQPDTGVTPHAELVGVHRVGGWDTVGKDADPTDPGGLFGRGHGTGTASVLVSPQTLQVVGAAPQASFMPIRATQSIVAVPMGRVADAITWAADHGAHVITMSLGGPMSNALELAVTDAVDRDVIVLGAAGNCVLAVVWPARLDDCIAVAGTDASDRRWPGSCTGSQVDVSAPAQNVWRAAVPDGAGPTNAAVGQGQGTSFSVALTAGVAALWLAHRGRAALVSDAHAHGETLQGMFLRLVRATARVPAGWNGSMMGAGVVDALALLKAPLDLGRARAVAAPRAARERGRTGEQAVRSLVAELVGPEAGDGAVDDWHRFGPELSAVLLQRQVDELAARARAARPPARMTSPQLAAAVRNPRLRDALGLD